MWLLIILAVNVNNPKDIPGRVSIEFATQQECLEKKATITSWVKFNSFKIETKCEQVKFNESEVNKL